MKEPDYVVSQNVAYLNIAIEVLRHVVITDEDNLRDLKFEQAKAMLWSLKENEIKKILINEEEIHAK